MANGHGGARPGGGRPSLVDEKLRARVIEKSWAIIDAFYNNANEDAKDKLKVASYLAGKSVPQDINLGGQVENPLTVNIIKNSTELTNVINDAPVKQADGSV